MQKESKQTRMFSRTKLMDELTDNINKLSVDSHIDIKVDDIKDYYAIQNFIRRSGSCFNKDVGVMFDKENMILKIVPRVMRKSWKSKEIKERKQECVIKYILSERL